MPKNEFEREYLQGLMSGAKVDAGPQSLVDRAKAWLSEVVGRVSEQPLVKTLGAVGGAVQGGMMGNLGKEDSPWAGPAGGQMAGVMPGSARGVSARLSPKNALLEAMTPDEASRLLGELGDFEVTPDGAFRTYGNDFSRSYNYGQNARNMSSSRLQEILHDPASDYLFTNPDTADLAELLRKARATVKPPKG